MDEGELIDDASKIIVKINERIHSIEDLIDKLGDEDPKTVAKLEGHLVAWYELLEKATHQAYQQGLTRTDLNKKIEESGGIKQVGKRRSAATTANSVSEKPTATTTSAID